MTVRFLVIPTQLSGISSTKSLELVAVMVQGGWEGGRSAELRQTLTATDAQISVPFKEVTVNAAVESEAKVEEVRLGAASGLWRAARSTLRSAAGAQLTASSIAL